MKQQYSAGIVTYRKEDGKILYLLLHYISGHWDLPKGKLEPGETKKEAALRELEEETGISEVTIPPGFEESLSYTFRDYDRELTNKTVTFLVGETKSKEVTLSHEHQGYAWLEYEDALEQLTYQNAKNLFAKAHQFIQALQ